MLEPRSAVCRALNLVWPHTFVSPSADSRGAVVSYWRKCVHEVLVYCLGGLSLPRKSVVRLTDRPDMTLDVCCGRKTTIQQQQQQVIYVGDIPLTEATGLSPLRTDYSGIILYCRALDKRE